MALTVQPKSDAPTVTCTIDGVEVNVPNGTTIYTAALQAGIEIPVLCHDERYDPVGVITIGHRAETPGPGGSPSRRPRTPWTEVVHRGQWGHPVSPSA